MNQDNCIIFVPEPASDRCFSNGMCLAIESGYNGAAEAINEGDYDTAAARFRSLAAMCDVASAAECGPPDEPYELDLAFADSDPADLGVESDEDEDE